jgi:hypothetical protein
MPRTSRARGSRAHLPRIVVGKVNQGIPAEASPVEPTEATGSVGLVQDNLEFLRFIDTAPDSTLLTRLQATVAINMNSTRFLEDMAQRGGPDVIPMVRVSARAIRYRLGDLRAWLASRIVRHTQQETSA